ncbi:MAG: hypothetical protein K8F91_18560 [Candidatus Obscuribacterales bacterium]|nr:hypothetical protein [Candidatus Obscuribacterales bacterium]
MLRAVFCPKDGKYYKAFSEAESRAIQQGRLDLVPHAYPMFEDAPGVNRYHGTVNPKTGAEYVANSAEDHYFISSGRPDLAIGSWEK